MLAALVQFPAISDGTGLAGVGVAMIIGPHDAARL
jgi:hypothetical protein